MHTSAKRWSPQARISTEPIVFEEALPCGPENQVRERYFVTPLFLFHSLHLTLIHTPANKTSTKGTKNLRIGKSL